MIANYACPVCTKRLFPTQKVGMQSALSTWICPHCDWMLAVKNRKTASRRAWTIALITPFCFQALAWFLLPKHWRELLILPDIWGMYLVGGWALGRVVYDRSIIITPIRKVSSR